LTGPVAGRLAVLKIGGVAVGKLRNVRIQMSKDIIKDYSMDQVNPEIFYPGEETYTFTAEKLWVDSVWVNSVIGQPDSGYTIEVYPEGTSSGSPKISLGNAIFTRWSVQNAMDGAAIENVEGEGKSISVGKAA